MHVGRKVFRNRLAGIITAVAAGSAFQISSCSIDNQGALSAFANPQALSDLRNQLFEASPLGQLLDGVSGSINVSVGEDE